MSNQKKAKNVKLEEIIIKAEHGLPEVICALCGETVHIEPPNRGCPDCGWWLRMPNDEPPAEWADGVLVKLGEHGTNLYWIGKPRVDAWDEDQPAETWHENEDE